MFEDEFEEFRARSYSGGLSPCEFRLRFRPGACRDCIAIQPDTVLSVPSRERDWLNTGFRQSSLAADPTPPSPAVNQRRSSDRRTDILFQRKEYSRESSRSTESRLLEVVLSKFTENHHVLENWNLGDMRPRVNSAPSKRLNGVQLLVRCNEDMDLPTEHPPLRKFRSFHLNHMAKQNRDSYFYAPPGNNQPVHASVGRGLKHLPATPSDKRTSCTGHSTLVLPSFNGIERHRVLMIGRKGVGKSTIVEHFLRYPRISSMPSVATTKGLQDGHLTDEDDIGCCNLRPKLTPSMPSFNSATDEQQLSSVQFIDISDSTDIDVALSSQPEVYVVMYSVEDRKSYEMAIDRLFELRHCSSNFQRGTYAPIILVANKVDLVRTRVVLEQEGKSTAKTYNVSKYIETSGTMDHQTDHLILSILRLIQANRRMASIASAAAADDGSTANGHLVSDKPDRCDCISGGHDQRQNSDSGCLVRTRDRVVARLQFFNNQRRPSKSCANLIL